MAIYVSAVYVYKWFTVKKIKKERKRFVQSKKVSIKIFVAFVRCNIDRSLNIAESF